MTDKYSPQLQGSKWKAPLGVAAGLIPVVALVFVYVLVSIWYDNQVAGNRVIPTPGTLWQGLLWTFRPLPVSGDIALVVDTIASLQRLLLALVLSVLLTLSMALLIFSFPAIRNTFHPTFVVVAKIPVIVLLPLMLVWMGFGEGVKIWLVALGIVPVMVTQMVEYLDSQSVALETKMNTLKMPVWQQWIFIWIPMSRTYFASIIQSALGAAWLFLLIAETFGTNQGLGYRIFILRARLWTDIIIIYVLWIALIAIVLHYLLEWAKQAWAWKW